MKGSKNLKNQTQTCTHRINQFFWKCQSKPSPTKQSSLNRRTSQYLELGMRADCTWQRCKLNLGNELNKKRLCHLFFPLRSGVSIYCQKLCQCLNSSFNRGATRSGRSSSTWSIPELQRARNLSHRPPNGHSHASEWNPGTFFMKKSSAFTFIMALSSIPTLSPNTSVLLWSFCDRHKVVIIRRFSLIWPKNITFSITSVFKF